MSLLPNKVTQLCLTILPSDESPYPINISAKNHKQ